MVAIVNLLSVFFCTGLLSSCSTSVSQSLLDSENNTGLSLDYCGPEYGGVNIEFSKINATKDNVGQFISTNSWVRKKFEPSDDYYTNGKYTSISKQLLKEWKRFNSGSNDFGIGNIVVPIGSEVYVAKEFLKSGLAKKVANLKEGCGAAETSYFYLPRSVGKLEDPKVFEAILRNRLQKLADSHKILKGQLIDKELKTVPIAPHFPVKRFNMRMPSELSRASGDRKSWDYFDLTFKLYQIETFKYIIVVYAENAAFAPRRGSRTTPPSKEHYRSSGRDEYQAELEIAARVANQISGGASNCHVGDRAGNQYIVTSDLGFKCADLPTF